VDRREAVAFRNPSISSQESTFSRALIPTSEHMCHMLYLATDCPDDLWCKNSDLVRFEKLSSERFGRQLSEPSSRSPRMLTHEHQWFVGSKSGYSCTFRHLIRESVSLGFGAPEHWFPEEQDAIAATHQLYTILAAIIERGHHVELLDCWNGDEDKEVTRLDVSLTDVTIDDFRLFEGHLFNLKA